MSPAGWRKFHVKLGAAGREALLDKGLEGRRSYRAARKHAKYTE